MSRNLNKLEVIDSVIRENALEALKILVKEGIDVNSVCCGAPQLLRALIHNGTNETSDFLIKSGATIMVEDHDELAEFFENIPFDEAVELGLDLLFKDRNGKTYLHDACYWNNLDIVEFILKSEHKNRLINDKDNEGKTPLLYHTSHLSPPFNMTLFNTLLKAGADINAQDNEGNTSLLLACLHNKETIVDALIDHNADVNICDKNGLVDLF